MRKGALLVALTLAARAAVASPMTPGTAESVATIHSIGVIWPITGDADYDATGTLRYRPSGTGTWNDALNLVRIDYWGNNHLAGSVLFLAADTDYEVEASIADPDGGSATQNWTVRTRAVPERPSGGQTLHVVPGSGGGDGSESNPYQGFATAWAQARAGDTVLLHAGSYGDVTDANGSSGDPGNPIVFIAAGNGDVVLSSLQLFNHSYLWFEDLHFVSSGSELGFYSVVPLPGYDNGFESMPNDILEIVLVRNRFNGFKHTILAGPRTRRWYIADNAIVGNKDQLGGSDTESFDGEGIELAHGDEHIVAHNSISHVADAVSFPDENCDIYGNDIFDLTDDGVEMDGGEANTRVWHNRIHNVGHNGFSFQPQDGGPWYILRNQLVNYQESAFKFRDTDRFIAAHNLFVNTGDVYDHWSGHLLRGIVKNNLFVSVGGGRIWRRSYEVTDWRTDMDYNGYYWGTNSEPFMVDGITYADVTALNASTGLEENGIQIDPALCFESFDIPGPPPLTTIPPQWMTLTSDCIAVDAGVVMANINDSFSGLAPDLGPYERDGLLPQYGPRVADDLPPAAPSNLVAE